MDKLAVGLAWVALGLVGCGETDDGSAAGETEGPEDGVVSGDAAEPLADLSDDEKVEVCESMSDRYDDAEAYGRGICIVALVENSGDLQSCDAAVEECVADSEFELPSIEECTDTLNFVGCDASVRELNDCVADQRKIAAKVAALRSCEDAEREAASDAWFDDAPACERLLDRCPEVFHGASNVNDSDISGSPEDSPYVIEGSADGKAVELRPGVVSRMSISEGSAGDRWTLGLSFGRVELWLWGETETGQGLLRMPWRGTGEMTWVCLETVEVDEGTDTTTWTSSKLSVLPVCAEGDPRPLELNFEGDGAVIGTLEGEAVAWVNTGYECYESCRFTFDAADTAGSGRNEWILDVDTLLEWGVPKAFEHATLIHPSGVAAVACGGGGVATYGEDNVIRIVVDALAPLSHCPGTPVDGELSGTL